MQYVGQRDIKSTKDRDCDKYTVQEGDVHEKSRDLDLLFPLKIITLFCGNTVQKNMSGVVLDGFIFTKSRRY